MSIDRVVVVSHEQPSCRYDVLCVLAELGVPAENVCEADFAAAADLVSERKGTDFVILVGWCTDDNQHVLRLVELARVTHPEATIIVVSNGGNEFGSQTLAAGARTYIDTEWKYVHWSNLLQQYVEIFARSLELRMGVCSR